jgi:hypothetical protein
VELERPLVFLDTETTGLDPSIHEVVEVAYSPSDDDNVRTLIVPHTLLHADPVALDINRYRQRGLEYRSLWAAPEEFEQMRRDLSGATICSANVVFDLSFIDRWISLDRHYRVMDLTSWAAGRLGWPATRGMEATYTECRSRFGAAILAPDHTAAGDVRSMKSIYKTLLEEI